MEQCWDGLQALRRGRLQRYSFARHIQAAGGRALQMGAWFGPGPTERLSASLGVQMLLKFDGGVWALRPPKGAALGCP